MLIVVIDDPYDRFRYNRQAYEMPVGGGIHRISSICGFEAMLWLRKGFGFAGAWTVRQQNRLLRVCFGLQKVNEV